MATNNLEVLKAYKNYSKFSVSKNGEIVYIAGEQWKTLVTYTGKNHEKKIHFVRIGSSVDRASYGNPHKKETKRTGSDEETETVLPGG